MRSLGIPRQAAVVAVRTLAFITLLAATVHGQPAQTESDAGTQEATGNALQIDFLEGPATAALGDIAEIDVPEGYRFTGDSGTQKIMQAFGNPISGRELGYLDRQEADWFLVFEFDDGGYVNDDEKDALADDALLGSIREGTRQSNEERRRRGWPTLEVVGWEHPPHYDEQTHNLEWAPRLRAENGGLLVNYNTRILGRRGVMEVTLVADTEQLAETLPTFKELLGDFRFTSGNTYAEYRKGDKLAKYGLGALVAGGAAAVALKTGLLAKIWKFLVIGVVAVVTALRKLIARLFGWGPDRQSTDEPPRKEDPSDG